MKPHYSENFYKLLPGDGLDRVRGWRNEVTNSIIEAEKQILDAQFSLLCPSINPDDIISELERLQQVTASDDVTKGSARDIELNGALKNLLSGYLNYLNIRGCHSLNDATTQFVSDSTLSVIREFMKSLDTLVQEKYSITKGDLDRLWKEASASYLKSEDNMETVMRIGGEAARPQVEMLCQLMSESLAEQIRLAGELSKQQDTAVPEKDF